MLVMLLASAAVVHVAAGCAVHTPVPVESSAPQPTSANHASELVRQELAPALAAVEAEPAHFGGAYFDDSGGWLRLRILVVGDDAESRARVAALLPLGAPVQWEQAAYSVEQLERIHAEIVDRWREVGIERINFVAVNTPSNRVIVSLPNEDLSLQGELNDRYGDAVFFRIEPPGKPL